MPKVLGDALQPNVSKSKVQEKVSVEQTYQKLTQHQHILQRPDTYVGSTEAVTSDMWVFDAETSRMRQRKLTYVPGLYKTFDEILVNAADNKQRDSAMNEIRVDIDKAAGRISIRNNGKGVPVTIHKEYKIYVPELIFGEHPAPSTQPQRSARLVRSSPVLVVDGPWSCAQCCVNRQLAYQQQLR